MHGTKAHRAYAFLGEVFRAPWLIECRRNKTRLFSMITLMAYPSEIECLNQIDDWRHPRSALTGVPGALDVAAIRDGLLMASIYIYLVGERERSFANC